LDIGGDKSLPYFPIEEENPFLGWRGIRISLDRPEIFQAQVRAMLRANQGLGNLKILLPMISAIREFDEAKSLIQEAYQEICVQEPVIMPPIGIMIEVPSAVYLARNLARRADFLSIGSNDLTQYLLAVDRNNAQVSGIYDAYHPAVLQALEQTVNAAKLAGKPVSICGELGGDPIITVLLMAMGFDMLSANPTNLSRIKWVLSRFTLAEMQEILKDVSKYEDSQDIRTHLEAVLTNAGLGALVHAGH
jgi:phosphotransferase system enzyme I (PtsP)